MLWKIKNMKIKKPVAKKPSLKLRLILMFMVTALIVWVLAGVLSWRQSAAQLDEFFDTYQLLLARQLASANWENIDEAVLNIDDDNFDDGEEEDEALGFAVFNANGQLVFSDDENGRYFRFNPHANGFTTARLKDKKDKWRLVWVKTADGHYYVAVGQALEFRHEAALEMVAQTLWPWLAGLGLLAVAVVFFVSREFRPIKTIAAKLTERKSHDLTPLETVRLPGEVLPLVKAINHQFQRIETMIKQERSFISDAAHELKSPLAALRVQAEVAGLTAHNPQKQQATLAKLINAIDRTARLVEQLLALSRLEQQERGEKVAVSLPTLIQDEIAFCAALQDKLMPEVVFEAADGPALLDKGYPLMLTLLLHNLFDNACKYGSPGAKLHIDLSPRELRFTNTCGGIAPEDLARLSERFFRPPGQTQPGSGLGLSIVTRIAEIHGLYMEITLIEPNLFVVALKKQF